VSFHDEMEIDHGGVPGPDRPEAAECIDDESWATLLAAECEVGVHCRRHGVMQRIWRVPGTQRRGVWSAADASELDRLLADLPAFRDMTRQVEALAFHYPEATE
jgi:muconolactone delta-isomerase